MVLGGALTGKYLDWDYRSIKNKIIAKAENEPEKGLSPEDAISEENFPIEKARLRTMPLWICLIAASCAGYGWCLQQKVNIAGPLVLQAVSKWMLS